MTMTSYIAIVSIGIMLRLIWLAGELWHRRRFPLSATKELDNHSSTFWDVANLIEPIGFVLAIAGVGRFEASALYQVVGLVFLCSGMVIRFSAMRTLGRFFTSVVTVHSDHQIISTGLYKYMRHPSYTGALLAHLGLGLAFGSWISLSLSVLPFLVAAWYRIRVEEEALVNSFGADYSRYAARTARLIPKIF